MQSSTNNPGSGAAAAHRKELYGELRKRNERHARVARLLEARRERSLQIERVVQVERARRFARHG